MINPYKILEISQNAGKKEIIQGKIKAMRKREFSLHEIQMAEKQLLDPTKRLIADYMYPSRLKSKRPKPIRVFYKPISIDLKKINRNAFDSLS